ncbi:hydrogen peroxide-inducible genes activator [Aureimonas sp. N4]|uniref:hydrogen peroxide-inducible genes activator n=1 Tax=Aureimonas sp. N4 TaxID=1638165 RepID=UPI0007820793|nr:hydrogen peroxide-inducible genes activator [Aureimonas sp. N4]
MLTLRQLRYFEALSETLHFGQAARRLNISQPALSAQIAQLEEYFGAALFERRSTGVAVTPEGERVKRRVRRILAEVRDLEALTQAHGELLVGQLRIGIIASLAPYLLPGLLAELARSYPRLTVGVRENVTAVLADELARGDLDCVVQALPVERKGVSTIPLCEDPFLLAVPEGSGDRIPAPVSPSQLESERLILLEEGHCLRDQALDVCRIAEQRDLATLGATSLNTLMRMVAGGLGVTLVPQSAVETEARAGGIRFLPFETPAPSRHLALAFRTSSGRRSDFERLAEMIRACLGPAEGSGHEKAGDTQAPPASI